MTRQRTRFVEQSKPANRRSGILPERRFALALALSGILLGCWGGTAAADNSGQLVTAIIYPASGGIKTESVSLATLQASCPRYAGPDIELYRQDGTQAPAETYNRNAAWSLAGVLGCLSPAVPLGAVKKILVEQSGAPELSANSQLLAPDLASPLTDFATPTEAPLIYSAGSGIVYLRPARAGGNDANALDRVTNQDPTPFVFEVFERPLLGATVTPSVNNPVPVGATVSFSAQAAGIGPGVQYSWDFGGAAPSQSGSNPSVTYHNAGTYNVTVQLTDTGGHVAQSPPLLVQVGTAPPTSTSPTAPPTGPNQSSGNLPGGAPGAGSKKSGTAGKHHGGKGPVGGKPTPAAYATKPGTGGSSNGSAHAGTGSSSGAGGAAASHRGGRGHARPAGGHGVKPRKARPAGTTGPARIVMGRLISNVTPLPAGASPLVHAVSGPLATAPAARRPITASLMPAIAAALLVFVLFSLGAGRELRWGRSWRVLLSGS